MRIEGVAYMPEPQEYPLTWRMPDGPIPLRVGFNPMRDPIGMAELTRHEDGTITCTAQIADDTLLKLVPKLAIGLMMPGYADRTTAEVYAVSVVTENQNRDIPPYTVIRDGDE